MVAIKYCVHQALAILAWTDDNWKLLKCDACGRMFIYEPIEDEVYKYKRHTVINTADLAESQKLLERFRRKLYPGDSDA